jgi:molybdopterin-guanine dinucleotide biosynthesis protein A
MHRSILGTVVAGGLSTRMGRDKAGLLLGGSTLAARAIARLRPQVDRIAFNGIASLMANESDVLVVADALPGHPGPLAGILAGLRCAQAQGLTHVASVTVDTPFFPLDLVKRWQEACGNGQEIAVAISGGAMHPVFALWPLTCADALQRFIETDEKRRVRGFIERNPHVMVDVAVSPGASDPFLNINTPADLARAERLLAEEGRA